MRKTDEKLLIFHLDSIFQGEDDRFDEKQPSFPSKGENRNITSEPFMFTFTKNSIVLKGVEVILILLRPPRRQCFSLNLKRVEWKRGQDDDYLSPPSFFIVREKDRKQNEWEKTFLSAQRESDRSEWMKTCMWIEEHIFTVEEARIRKIRIYVYVKSN